MELAGLSVATVIKNCYPVEKLSNKKVLIACGPGKQNDLKLRIEKIDLIIKIDLNRFLKKSLIIEFCLSYFR